MTSHANARIARRTRLWPMFLIAPAAIYLLVLMGYPLIEGFRLSLTDTSLLNPKNGTFVGLENFGILLSDPTFWSVLVNTVVYTIACVLGALAFGLLAALGMNWMTGRLRILRGLVIIPWAAPIIPVALVSAWILDNQYGVLNWALKSIGLIDANVQWLTNPATAMPSIIVITVWRIFPFSAIVLLAALQGVAAELYEAARVDGAGTLNRFRHVTLPGIAPTLGILGLFVTIWSIRRFDLIWVLTEGGPLGSTTTLVIDLYHTAFRGSDLGMGSAIGMIGLVISTLVTIVYFVVQSRTDNARSARRG